MVSTKAMDDEIVDSHRFDRSAWNHKLDIFDQWVDIKASLIADNKDEEHNKNNNSTSSPTQVAIFNGHASSESCIFTDDEDDNTTTPGGGHPKSDTKFSSSRSVCTNYDGPLESALMLSPAVRRRKKQNSSCSSNRGALKMGLGLFLSRKGGALEEEEHVPSREDGGEELDDEDGNELPPIWHYSDIMSVGGPVSSEKSSKREVLNNSSHRDEGASSSSRSILSSPSPAVRKETFHNKHPTIAAAAAADTSTTSGLWIKAMTSTTTKIPSKAHSIAAPFKDTSKLFAASPNTDELWGKAIGATQKVPSKAHWCFHVGSSLASNPRHGMSKSDHQHQLPVILSKSDHQRPILKHSNSQSALNVKRGGDDMDANNHHEEHKRRRARSQDPIRSSNQASASPSLEGASSSGSKSKSKSRSRSRSKSQRRKRSDRERRPTATAAAATTTTSSKSKDEEGSKKVLSSPTGSKRRESSLTSTGSRHRPRSRMDLYDKTSGHQCPSSPRPGFASPRSGRRRSIRGSGGGVTAVGLEEGSAPRSPRPNSADHPSRKQRLSRRHLLKAMNSEKSLLSPTMLSSSPTQEIPKRVLRRGSRRPGSTNDSSSLEISTITPNSSNHDKSAETSSSSIPEAPSHVFSSPIRSSGGNGKEEASLERMESPFWIWSWRTWSRISTKSQPA